MRSSVELQQGTIHYRDEGEGAPLVFVHGLLVDGRLWRNVTPPLARPTAASSPDWPLGSHTHAAARRRGPLAARASRT